MTVYGLTQTGFVPKSLSVVRADLDAAMRAAFGASLVLGDQTILGQIDGIMAERYAELWALAQAVYSSQDVDAATGAALDALCKLTGTFRPQATFSSVSEILTGTPASPVSHGTIVAAASTGVQFQTSIDATIASVSAWAPTTLYTAGNRVTNSSKVYQCITGGTSAGSGGPTGSSPDIPDGTVHWTFLGAGTGAVDVVMTSVLSGPVIAVAKDLTNINVTPVAGLLGAINLLDAVAGNNIATDQQLRLLRESELGGEGGSTGPAIEAAILKVDGVTACTVYENDSDVTDANGLPPHAIEALVQGGADADIAAALFGQVAAGIVTHGTTTVSVTDSQGVAHAISFSRPVEIDIYVDVTLTYDESAYPQDGDNEVKLAIIALAYPAGLDVRASRVNAGIYAVPGILDVEPLYIGTAPSPATSTTIVVNSRSIAVFDTSRITVRSSAATP